MLSVIGKGAYGKVLLVKKKEKDLTKQADGELYAMKVLKKSEILRRNQVEHTMTERRILVSIPLIHVNNRAP
jgi:serine/threonine protein kinase